MANTWFFVGDWEKGENLISRNFRPSNSTPRQTHNTPVAKTLVTFDSFGLGTPQTDTKAAHTIHGQDIDGREFYLRYEDRKEKEPKNTDQKKPTGFHSSIENDDLSVDAFYFKGVLPRTVIFITDKKGTNEHPSWKFVTFQSEAANIGFLNKDFDTKKLPLKSNFATENVIPLSSEKNDDLQLA